MEENYTYYAFISYKREDEEYAKRLRRSLQAYRLPAKTHKRYPKLDKRCRPVFLDKVDLAPGILDERLYDEVSSSKFFIVICSKYAHEESRYLDDELRYFLESGGDPSRVIPFIVDKCDDAQAECFPKGLSELCAKQNVVGPSIHDDGWQSAIIKTVARMHGIRPVELENDDMRRQKKRKIAATLAVAVALFIGFLCWDFFRTETAYYLDYTEVYGLPVGIHALTDAEVKSIDKHWAITYSRSGNVIELRCEDSYGQLVNPITIDDYNCSAQALYSYKDGNLHSVERRNENGITVLKLEYINYSIVNLVSYENKTENDASENSSLNIFTAPSFLNSFMVENFGVANRIKRYLISYDASGYVEEIHYASNALNLVATDAEGVSGLRYQRDSLGRVKRVYYLKYVGSSPNAEIPQSFEVAAKPNGVAGMEFERDERGQLVRIGLIDSKGLPISDKDDVSACTFEYDVNHRVTGCYLYDVTGQLVLDKTLGFAGWNVRYDSHGNPVRVSFFDTDGEPAMSEDGYAVWDASYDSHGNPVRVSFFDTDGEPAMSKDGYAEWHAGYDDSCKVNGITWFNAEGEVVNVFGSSQYIDVEYDASGNITRKSYYDTKGYPMLCAGGYASYQCEYDARGNMIMLIFYDTDGEPVLCKDGYASVTWEYDAQGNVTDTKRYGVDGELL